MITCELCYNISTAFVAAGPGCSKDDKSQRQSNSRCRIAVRLEVGATGLCSRDPAVRCRGKERLEAKLEH